MPKVSVIIPCYNAMRFLPRTVDSVLKQSCQDFEIILINDGSADHIEQWANTLEDERIHLISQANQGPATARNTGIKHAGGEYIAFLDADDLWHPLKLEKQVDALEANPKVGLVYTWVLLIDEQDNPLEDVWKTSHEGDVWETLIEGNMIACGSVPMVRSACIESIGLFETFAFACEDWDFWLRIAARYPFKVIKEILVYYRESPTSLSRSRGNSLGQELAKIEKSYRYLIEKAFQSAPEKLRHLEARSQALVSLDIAWKALKSPGSNRDYVQHYRRQAISYYPQVSFLSEYKKINRAALFIRFLGVQNYEKLKQLSRIAKHR